MVQSILVLHAGRPYDFTDEKQRRYVGRKISFVIRGLEASGEEQGVPVIAQSISLEVSKKLKEVPGIYEAAFDIRMKDGHPEFRIKDVDAASATAVDL